MLRRREMKSAVEDALREHPILQQISMKHFKRFFYKLDAIDETTGTFKTEEALDEEIEDLHGDVTVCRVKFMQTMRRLGFSSSDGRLLSKVYSVLDLHLKDEVNVAKCVAFFQSLRNRLGRKSIRDW